MTFMDQYGWHPEVAPFADFFVEDPCAPMFGLGISHGKDIFGYETNYRLTERPYGWLFDNMQVFVGGSGFGVRHGEIDEKSFGIFEGINWSGSISPRLGLSAQFGVRAVQRTIDGSHPAFGEKDWESGGKGQVFITAGFFKRAQSMPFQVGLVYDWMSDTKYKNRDGGKALNVGQIRTEFSYASACGWTFGFRGAFSGADDDPLNDTLYQVKTTNYFLGFVEKDIWCGSLLSFQAGGTKEGNAILGLCYDQPLYDKFSIKTEFNYMLEKENSSTLGPKDRDGWEAMITFTFHPHGGAFNRSRNPLRAMFDVASNGTMFLSHK